MPVEKGYVNDFRNACNHYFKYWDVPIDGFSCAELIKSYDDFNVYSVNNEKKIFLLIDDIPYPLEEHKDIQSYKFFNTLGVSMKIALKFKTGELPVQPSREDIRYTKEAIEAINKKLLNLKLDEILVDVFKDLTCANLRNFTNEQLYSNRKYIKDKNLFYILDILYKKYAGRGIPNLYYDSGKYEVSASQLIKLVGYNKNAYILSPSEEKFLYKAHKLSWLRQKYDTLIISFNEKHLENNVLINELINVMNLFPDVKYDYEIEYTPPAKIARLKNGFSGISYRFLSNGRLANNTAVNIEQAIVIEVENLKEVDDDFIKDRNDSYKLLKYISLNSTTNFIFVSGRYSKHFEKNVKLSDYKKQSEYIGLEQKLINLKSAYSKYKALNDVFDAIGCYFYYEELQRNFGEFLKKPNEINFSNNRFLNNFNGQQEIDKIFYHNIKKELEEILSTYAISKTFRNLRYCCDVEILNELKKLKNVRKKFQTNMHSLNNFDKLRGRKIKHKKSRLSRGLRKSTKTG